MCFIEEKAKLKDNIHNRKGLCKHLFLHINKKRKKKKCL